MSSEEDFHSCSVAHSIGHHYNYKQPTMNSAATFIAFCCFALLSCSVSAFSVVRPSTVSTTTSAGAAVWGTPSVRSQQTQLRMSEREMEKKTKKKVQILFKEDTEQEEDENNEEEWRVILHNDEVHTFHYVVRSLTKVISTLDRKAAFEVCVQTHGTGKATITTAWKKLAEQYCLGLQRQGLTVSIAPDTDFEGGHSGGNV